MAKHSKDELKQPVQSTIDTDILDAMNSTEYAEDTEKQAINETKIETKSGKNKKGKKKVKTDGSRGRVYNVKARKKGGVVKFDEKLHPIMILALYEEGATDLMVCQGLGITLQTLHNWKKKYPDLLDATEAKNAVDKKVELALLKVSLGHEVEESEVSGVVNAQGVIVGERRIKKTKKYIAPSVAGATFWLKNRQAKKWRDRSEVAIGKLAELDESALTELIDAHDGKEFE